MSVFVDRLREYRPTNEWGDGVHHVICTEAAERMEFLETALARIAGMNDLSGVADEHIESDARHRLYECELIAREALDFSPDPEPPTPANIPAVLKDRDDGR